MVKKEKVVLAGVATAVLAGSLFLYGKEGKKKRKKIQSWMLKMKGDVLARIEKLSEIGEEKYESVVESVAHKYKKIESVENKEIDTLARELKKHWKDIEKELSGKKKK